MNKCEKQYELDKNPWVSIDIGLNNLATLTFKGRRNQTQERSMADR